MVRGKEETTRKRKEYKWKQLLRYIALFENFRFKILAM